MKMKDLFAFYDGRVNEFESARKKVAGSKVTIGWLRLLVFLLIPLSGYLLYPDWKIIVPIVIVLLGVFLWLVSRFTDLSEKHAFYERLVAMNQAEKAALRKEYTAFDSGSEFSDPGHPYAIDMDLFHKNGLFAFLNRTATRSGKRMLAQYLLQGSKDRKHVQAVIEDLKHKTDWRQKYLAASRQEDEEMEEAAERWIQFPVKKMRVIRILRWVLPVFSLSSLVFWQAGVLSDMQFILSLLIPMFLIGTRLKETNKILFTSSKAGEKWKSILFRLNELEKCEFDSKEMQVFKEKLLQGENSSREALRRITRLIDLADYRLNMLMGIVLNIFLAWDFWMQTLQMDWLAKYNSDFGKWENDLAHLEVWICAANYAHNRQDLTYGRLEGSQIQTERLGHPLLSPDETVYNDFQASGETAFSIITGPNMAGKSTFLRSVGVNLILARCGFPVVAEQFVMPDLLLYSSMRTTDDLSSSASYFFAELSRLRFIVDAIERGEKVFIILDEILKGTNSIDKEKGSAAFLNKLNELGAKGIIATHDLSLCRLGDESSAFQNLYFDSIIEKDELTFDYKMRAGVCQNMNASFLLKKMGLT
ncbi:MutS family DNA mismatch repair protein [Wandonia haliotis]|uniref:MutS family DNA mismatch repair protein n=2 Tax=Wandonia haliotis TaxID=574963 RepID=A0ABP3Y4K6_9FLAO